MLTVWKFADVVGHPNQQSGSFLMVSTFHMQLFKEKRKHHFIQFMATLIQIPTIIKLQPRIFSIWWNTTYYLFPIVGLGRLVPALKYALHKQFLNTEVYAILVTDNISTTKPVLQLIKGSGNVSLLHFASIHHLPPFWQHIYKTVHNCMETVCNFLNRFWVQT